MLHPHPCNGRTAEEAQLQGSLEYIAGKVAEDLAAGSLRIGQAVDWNPFAMPHIGRLIETFGLERVNIVALRGGPSGQEVIAGEGRTANREGHNTRRFASGRDAMGSTRNDREYWHVF